MRRALDEYLVMGVKTTLPFFRWLFQEPGFCSAIFHTTYLDDMLKVRNGRPFADATPESAELAAIAVAIQAFLSPGSGTVVNPVGEGTSRWRARALVEGLGEPDQASEH
jgi:acetyl/propionyl-CoA carboxylase alpha subunit